MERPPRIDGILRVQPTLWTLYCRDKIGPYCTFPCIKSIPGIEVRGYPREMVKGPIGDAGKAPWMLSYH